MKTVERRDCSARQRDGRRLAIGMVLLVVWLIGHSIAAHPGYPGSALVHVDPDGRVVVYVRHDVLAFALNETPALIGDDPMRALLRRPDELRIALAEGRERFLTLFELTADGQPVEIELTTSPTAEEIEAKDSPDKPIRLPIMRDVVVEGRLPAGTTTMTFRFPDVMGEVVATIERPGSEPFSLPLRAGEQSPDMQLHRIEPPPEKDPPESDPPDTASPETTSPETYPRTTNEDPSPSTRTSEDAAAPLAAPLAVPMSAMEVAWRYIVLGTTHILPRGLDHMLFVLGLFFLSTRAKTLLWQVTTFTLAHSVTLTLATLGVVRLPASIVEPIIAASIAFVAIENLMTTRLHAWRPMIVFAFGLVHGMGFAGALKDLGLPRGQLASALVSFNVGVEVGQLGVIAIAAIILYRWRKKLWYRKRIAIPASALIAAAGVWWTVQRIFGW